MARMEANGVEVPCRTREVVPEEPRDADPRAVLGLIDDAHGAWRCHAAFEMLGPSARPGSIRARRSCGFVACSGIGCPGWSAGTTGRSAHDPSQPPRRETTIATPTLARPARTPPRHLGTWAFVANLVGLVVVVAAVRILA
jgi:hypothetical protein